MAGEEPTTGGRPKKPAPPGVRIKASESGAKVSSPVRPLESRPAEPATPPPHASGSSLEVAEPKPREVAQARAVAEPPPAPSGKPSKPPPPHIQRGETARSLPPTAPAPREESAPAKPPEAPVRVKVTEVRAAAPSAKEPAPEKAAEPAPPATPDGLLQPHITTDAGKLSALWAAILLVLVVFVAEALAGIVSHSLALVSDAGHVFMDLFAYGLAYAAVAMSQRRSNERETFGAHRAEIVAAFVSGMVLIGVVAVIFLEAFSRLSNPQPIDPILMIVVPLLSVAVNLYLSRRFQGSHDLNMRGAHLHILSDLLSALGVLFAGAIILATGPERPLYIFDPIISFFIGALILRGTIPLLRDSAEILLERTPAHVNMPEIIARLKETPGVTGVHSVHVWSLCSTVHALSAHVVAAPGGGAQGVVAAVRARVEHDFGIHFTTIQVETEDCGAEQHPSVVHGVGEAVSRAHSHA